MHIDTDENLHFADVLCCYSVAILSQYLIVMSAGIVAVNHYSTNEPLYYCNMLHGLELLEDLLSI